jgi:carboxyl-terminal processing protease
MKPTTAWFLVAPLVGTVIAFGAALVVTRHAEARPGDGVYWDEDEVEYVRRMVAATYVDPVDEAKSRQLFYDALDGYVKGLPDDYNDFIPPDEYKRWKEDTAGRYAGVGVKIAPDPRGLRIDGVFPGGPAAKAGLKVGEVVTTVEGRSVAGLDPKKDENVRALKGAAGTAVRVKVLTPPAETKPAKAAGEPGGDASPPSAKAPAPAPAAGTEPAPAKDGGGTLREVLLVRAEIRPPTVYSRRVGKDDRVGYIHLTEFTEATPDAFDRALDAMVAAGVKAVVVDLRGNGGGVLGATVHVADRFVAEGEIVRINGRTRENTRVERAHVEDTIPATVGLVVLVDGGSASASEVLAGCIQDHRRGVLLGTRTYGKFLVQNITEIPGRNAALKLTTARYQTPLGRSFQRPPKTPKTEGAGLTPDVVVELGADDRRKLEEQWANADDATWGGVPQFDEVSADWVDPQLARALELIDGDLQLKEGGAANPPKKG